MQCVLEFYVVGSSSGSTCGSGPIGIKRNNQIGGCGSGSASGSGGGSGSLLQFYKPVT